jgi:hypothetical protein
MQQLRNHERRTLAAEGFSQRREHAAKGARDAKKKSDPTCGCGLSRTSWPQAILSTVSIASGPTHKKRHLARQRNGRKKAQESQKGI